MKNINNDSPIKQKTLGCLSKKLQIPTLYYYILLAFHVLRIILNFGFSHG